MSNEFFLDTAYAIALSVESDAHHQRAEELAEQLLANQTPLVTTRAVLLEIGNALSKQRYRQAAGELLDALERDPQVEIVLITEELYQQALALFCSRLDKEWGLIDCVSLPARAASAPKWRCGFPRRLVALRRVGLPYSITMTCGRRSSA